MARIRDIYNFIDDIAAFEKQLDFDNSGFLIGNIESKVSKAVVSLDITTQVIEEAESVGAELIISHHPVIFKALKAVFSDSLIYSLIQKNIAVISAHSNLDFAENIGVNANLGRYLNLKNIKPIFYHRTIPVLFEGEILNSLESKCFAECVKKSLMLKNLRYIKSARPIKRVSFSCGAAGDLVYQAIKSGSDAFVSGDIKYHDFLAAKEANMTVVDAGHFATEDMAIQNLTDILAQKFPEITFNKSRSHRDIVEFLI